MILEMQQDTAKLAGFWFQQSLYYHKQSPALKNRKGQKCKKENLIPKKQHNRPKTQRVETFVSLNN
jgi:hypothetical protein